MIKPLIARIATVLGGAALAAAAVVGFAGTANAAGLCQLDRPCSSLGYNSSTATVTARINPGNPEVDFYQVRWSINRNGAVQNYPQQRINPVAAQGTATFGPIAAADRSFVISYSAQSCDSGVFGTSCTPWESQTIVPLPYGPDTCASGYVWRDAFAGDHICVTPASRNQAASDNAAASSRVNPNGAYGPNTCINGYVWRVARSTDLVCVTPAVRTQTATENANPTAHRA
jgi:hypothetical protein